MSGGWPSNEWHAPAGILPTGVRGGGAASQGNPQSRAGEWPETDVSTSSMFGLTVTRRGVCSWVGVYLCALSRAPPHRVKFAKHKNTGEGVAIKIMNKSIIKERDFTAQVKHEVWLGEAAAAGLGAWGGSTRLLSARWQRQWD